MTSFSQRTKRYVKVAASAARVGAGVAASRIKNAGSADHGREAALIRAALGGLKGPLMKIGQLLAAIPDFLPREYAAELATLQADAPSMGWPFVRRRMASELGPDWQKKFKSFEPTARHAASLGQVHRAVALDGRNLACKLQYPNMESVIEADLSQLHVILSLFEKFDGAVSTEEAFAEIADRLREELDYGREGRNMALYRHMLADVNGVHVPELVPELSTPRLLSMEWLQGEKLAEAIPRLSQHQRNEIAMTMFRLWYAPFYHYGVIHGDPHMGNYTLRPDGGINLLDFGCIRVFRSELVQAVIMLFDALRNNKPDQAVEAYRLWGFVNPSKELIETLNIWARFIYAPVLEDRIRPIEETNATSLGREAAFKVHKELKKLGAVSIPREFVLMDRASIGLGGLFLRLGAEVNWYRIFAEMTEGFSLEQIEKNQSTALNSYLQR